MYKINVEKSRAFLSTSTTQLKSIKNHESLLIITTVLRNKPKEICIRSLQNVTSNVL